VDHLYSVAKRGRHADLIDGGSALSVVSAPISTCETLEQSDLSCSNYALTMLQFSGTDGLNINLFINLIIHSFSHQSLQYKSVNRVILRIVYDNFLLCFTGKTVQILHFFCFLKLV